MQGRCASLRREILGLAFFIIAAVPLSARAGDSGEPATSTDSPHPCAQGFCGEADENGVISYWASKDKDGRYAAGFNPMLEWQKRYNRWATANLYSGRFPSLTFVDQSRGGWRGNSLFAPKSFPLNGRLHPDSLLIPVYMNGGDILILRQSWQKDCRLAEPRANLSACDAPINAPIPKPRNALLAERADLIAAAYSNSIEYQNKTIALDKFLEGAPIPPDRRNQVRLDLSRVSADTLAQLGDLEKKVEDAVRAAEQLERRYIAEKDPLE